MNASTQHDPAECHVCGRHAIGIGFAGRKPEDTRWLCAECALIVEDIKKVKRMDAFELRAREGGVEAAADVIAAYGTELSEYTDEQAAMLAGAIWKGCAARLRELIREGEAPF
ncbi:DUF6511 domain-containing protein [Pseudaminobacter sp. NGMCC 1.201702]|uniref:DUF6511 domain-containing protein n=1 Tax=Pseudaminobacter sp. NGMCC 1.201702 TaxID=3391825 RepID=UPI0039EF7553